MCERVPPALDVRPATQRVTAELTKDFLGRQRITLYERDGTVWRRLRPAWRSGRTAAQELERVRLALRSSSLGEIWRGLPGRM